LAIRHQATREDEHSARKRRDVLNCLRKLANAYIKSGDTIQARRSLDDALALAGELHSDDPEDIRGREEYAKVLFDLGQVCRAISDYGSARQHFEAALAEYKALSVKHPENADYLNRLVRSKGALATIPATDALPNDF
jgi:tetratricopeptide (TPR) repeat protein